MKLDEKALEAATAAVHFASDEADAIELAETAIRAYLSAVPSSPVSELVDVTQPIDDIYVRDGFCDWADVANARDEVRNLHTTALTTLSARNAELERGIDRLAAYIMESFPGEPSENQGAVDTAIRLLGKNAELEREVKRLREAVDLLETANSLRRNSMGDVNYDTFYDGPSVEELEDQAHALSTSPQGGAK